MTDYFVAWRDDTVSCIGVDREHLLNFEQAQWKADALNKARPQRHHWAILREDAEGIDLQNNFKAAIARIIELEDWRDRAINLYPDLDNLPLRDPERP